MVNDSSKEDCFSNNVLADISGWIDKHLYGVRYASFGIGVIGLVVLARTVRLTKRFIRIHDIPERFISKHVCLQGRVVQVSPTGILSIQHIPILSTKWSKPPQDVSLPVSLTAVDLLPPGINWLQSSLQGQQVWFRLMSSTDNCEVSAIVAWKQKWYKKTMNVNLHLVSGGMATYKCEEKLIGDKMYDKFAAILCQAEVVAEKKGRGIWQRPTWRERIKAYPQKMKENLLGKKEDIKTSWSDWLNIQLKRKTRD